MANFTKNYETTGGMGGARPLDTYDLDLPLTNGGVVKSLDFGIVNPIHSPNYDGNKPIVKTTEEVVRTGTLPAQLVSYQPVVNLSSEEKFYQSLGITTKGGYDATIKAKGRLLLLVVLVGGYFAYKKFKK